MRRTAARDRIRDYCARALSYTTEVCDAYSHRPSGPGVHAVRRGRRSERFGGGKGSRAVRGRRREPLSPILVARPEARPAGSVAHWVLPGSAAVWWWYDGGSAPASGYDAGASAAAA